ncbi:hypothetical protein A2U01_0066820, partial [Trifolium medium]|nr:hypothetical protein [Trifolium medium]
MQDHSIRDHPFLHERTEQSAERRMEKAESESTTTEETKVDAHQLSEESNGVVISSLFFSLV